jgi:hypothetical protein
MNSAYQKFIVFPIFAILVLSFSSCKNCTTVMVDYIEKEPYTDYEVSEETLTYNIVSNSMYYERIAGATLFNTKPKIKIKCDVENTGSKSGFFRLYAKVKSDDGELYLSNDIEIEAGRIKTIYAIEEISHYSFQDFTIDEWKVIPPTVSTKKEVIKYREITKQRPCNTCEENCNQSN